MLLTAALLASAASFHVEHTPPACFLADEAPRVVACLAPRSARAGVRVLFRADDGPFYAAALQSDVPCYVGVLPRPSRSAARVTYAFEAAAGGVVARSADFSVPVAADASACGGRPAPVARGARAAYDAPPGAPGRAPGFEGRPPGAGTVAAAAPPPSPPAPRAAVPVPPRPTPRATPGPPPVPTQARPRGHAVRNLAIVVGAGGAAAGTALTLRNRSAETDGPPATTLGTGLPAGGIAGRYEGTETVDYPGGCRATDDIVLTLDVSGGAVAGVLSFTVRPCACCSAGRGANPVSGSSSGTSLQFQTVAGFAYSGAFAGNRVTGQLSGPGGIAGTWSADKR